MELDSIGFWAFLSVSILVVLAAGGSPSRRSWVLLALSVVYALLAGPMTLPVLLILGIGTIGWSRRIASDPARKSMWLTLGVATLTLPLLMFKYLPAVVKVGGDSFLTKLSLPIGISYVTFSSISHLVETAESPRTATKVSARDTLTALFFFPKLVSGPITRAHEMLPQLERAPRLTSANLRYAVLLVVVGVTKKHLADLLAPFVHNGFDLSGSSLSTIDAWIAALAFAGQLYAEFSGYTDIARGAGSLLGVELPPNFNLPYLATSPIDFWGRWHISLSSWLRDHIFMPIAVRGRWLAPGIGLVVTLTIGGLWHGANLTFALWGLYQAGLIAASYALGFGVKRVAPGLATSRLVQPFRIAGTFFFILLGLVLFRAPTIRAAAAMVGAMFAGAPGHVSRNTTVVLVLVLISLVLTHLVDFAIGNRARIPTLTPQFVRRPLRFWAITAVCVTFLLMTGGAEAEMPLYARF